MIQKLGHMARYCQKTVEFVLQELVQLKREVSVTVIKNIQKRLFRKTMQEYIFDITHIYSFSSEIYYLEYI